MPVIICTEDSFLKGVVWTIKKFIFALRNIHFSMGLWEQNCVQYQIALSCEAVGSICKIFIQTVLAVFFFIIPEL